MSRLPDMAKPVMELHATRYPPELWAAAQAKAKERDENVSDVLRAALEAYVKRPAKKA